MIVDAILSLLFTAGRGFLELLPDWTPPSFLGDLPGYANTVGEYASGVAYWVPFDTAGLVVTAAASVFALVTGARFALWLWAKIPVVGK